MKFFPGISLDSETNYSTTHALFQLYEKIPNGLDTKAFDTVNKEILLNKLEHYEVRSIVLQWFKSYLSCWKQFVQYNGYNFSLLDITRGVP